jgi:GDPmannose 4,6-dehydratase
MWLMMQQDEPDDFVLATGESHSIRDFLDIAFDEVGIDNWEDLVVIDPQFFRPAEIEVLRGDATKAEKILGWTPKTTFEQLVRKMVRSDLALIQQRLGGRL